MVPREETVCPHCAERQKTSALHPETVLLLTIPALVILFLITGFSAKFFHAKEAALAQEWYSRGESALAKEDPNAAIADLRTALVYSRGNATYRLQLAEALIAAHRADEAHSYLLNLWEQQPGSAKINLALARLAANQNDLSEAVRYYHGAIYGLWERDPDQNRWQTRMELCRLLLSAQENNMAQSELIALTDHLPKDSPMHTAVGSMFLQIKDYPRALSEFRLSIQSNRKAGDALAGAGEAAFQDGDFHSAERYFDQARRLNVDVDAGQLQTVRLAAGLDPFEQHLSEVERNRRVVEAYDRMWDHLEKCATTQSGPSKNNTLANDLQNALSSASKLRAKVTEKNLLRHPNEFPGVMAMIFQMERAVSNHCGPAPLEKALVMIQRHSGGAE